MSRQRTRRQSSPGEGRYYPARSSTPVADAHAAFFGRQRTWYYHVHNHRVLDASNRASAADRSCEWCRKEGFIGRLFGGPRVFPNGVPPTITTQSAGSRNFPEACFRCGGYHPWVGA